MNEIEQLRSAAPEPIATPSSVRQRHREALLDLIDRDTTAEATPGVSSGEKTPTSRPRKSLLLVGATTMAVSLAVGGTMLRQSTGVQQVGERPTPTTQPPESERSKDDSRFTAHPRLPLPDAAAFDQSDIANYSGKNLLLLAARNALEQPTTDKPIRKLEMEIDADGTTSDYIIWRNENGSGFQIVTEDAESDPELEAMYPLGLNSAAFPVGSVSGEGAPGVMVGDQALDRRAVESLPLDPTELASTLAEFREGLPGESNNPEKGVVDAATRLLAPGLAPPEIRAALFAMLANIEGIKVTEGRKAPDGRPATTIEYPARLFNETFTDYIDPETSELLAWASASTSGVYRSVSFETAMPDIPEGLSYDWFGVYSGCVKQPNGGVSVVSHTPSVLLEGPVVEGDETQCPTEKEVLQRIDEVLAAS